MDRRIVRARPIAVIVMTMLAVAIASGAIAQTLTDPYPKTNSSPPAAKKSQSDKHVKNCSAYGAGFMVMPGTDMCIKVGGSVTVEAGH